VSIARVASADARTVEIVVNGQPRQVPEGLTLDGLLQFLDIPAARVAVERNRSIARKAEWNATRIEPGDRLEIVWFVGGG
jgi:sulfur carrier protein